VQRDDLLQVTQQGDNDELEVTTLRRLSQDVCILMVLLMMIGICCLQWVDLLTI
jgi:hypothetical protein